MIPPPTDEPPGVVTHTLSYNIDKLKFTDSQTIEDGYYASPIAEPVMADGYVFLGWYTDANYTNKYDFNSPVIESTELYGKIIQSDESARETYTVTFISDGTKKGTLSFVSGDVCPYLSLEKEDYAFGGWYRAEQSGTPDSKEQFEFNTPLYQNITLYANWIDKSAVKKVTVTLYDESRQKLATRELDQGSFLSDIPEDFGIECPAGYYLTWIFNNGVELDRNNHHFNVNTNLYVKKVIDENSSYWGKLNLIFWSGDDIYPTAEEIIVGETLSDIFDRYHVYSGYRVLNWHTSALLNNVWDKDRAVELSDLNNKKTLTLYAELESIAVPYYNPTLSDYVEGGELIFVSSEGSYTYYVYYLGTASDIIIHMDGSPLYANRNETEIDREFTRIEKIEVEEKFEERISKSIINLNSTEVDTSTPSSNDDNDGWLTALDVASASIGAAGIATGLFCPPAGVLLEFVAGLGAAASFIFHAIDDADTATEKANVEDVKTTITKTTEKTSHYTSETIDSISYRTKFNSLVPNQNCYVSYVSLADVEYLQIIRCDSDGNCESRISTNIINNEKDPKLFSWVCTKDGNFDIVPIYEKDAGKYIEVIDKTASELRDDELTLINRLSEFEGSGTEEDPFVVSSPSVLKLIDVSLTFSNAHYVLSTDIDLSEESWTPPKEFNGVLDGNGKKITGLNITSAHESGCAGLFSRLGPNALIYDLELNGANINIGNDSRELFVGTLCGYNNGTIRNVTVSDSSIFVESTTPSFIGGIAGWNKLEIDNCDVKSCEITGYGDIAGIVATNNKDLKSSTVNDTTLTYLGKDTRHSAAGLAAWNEFGRILNCKVEDSSILYSKKVDNWQPHHMGYLVGDAVNGYIDDTSTATNCSSNINGMNTERVFSDDRGYIGWGFINVQDNTDKYYVDSWKSLRYLESSGFKSYSVVLKKDLNLNGWDPIFEFNGVFDGNGKTITYSFNGTPEDVHNAQGERVYGFVSKLYGTVRNTNFNVSIISHSVAWQITNVGAVAGVIDNGVVENCNVYGSISTHISKNDDRRICVGGIAGLSLNNSVITMCKISASLTADASFADCGGVVGRIYGGSPQIKNCLVESMIHAWGFSKHFLGIPQGDYYSNAGGILGSSDKGSAWIRISNCYVASDLIKAGGANYMDVGAFAGKLYSGSMELRDSACTTDILFENDGRFSNRFVDVGIDQTNAFGCWFGSRIDVLNTYLNNIG